MTDSVAVGVVGTSWWADAMHLPALKNHPNAQISAICGRNLENANEIASRWNIPHVYTDYNEMIDSGKLNAIVVSTANDTHYDITVKALEAGLHVLCEKPIALTYRDAQKMADMADQKGLKNLVPFTYSYMPTTRYLKELVDTGYIGKPYHLNMRYYTGYGRKGDDYIWRFDVGKAGAGVIGDIGSHFLYIARWLFGEITSVYAQLGFMIPRPVKDNAGNPYEVADDNAVIVFEFENGAQGVIQVSTLAYEGTHFGQTHHIDLHGSDGTLYSFTDWNTIQRISGTRQGEGAPEALPIPERVWGDVRRDTVHNTYKDVFRTQDFMTRQFITGIVENKPLKPDFQDGARIQRIIEAAVKSHHEGRRIAVNEIS